MALKTKKYLAALLVQAAFPGNRKFEVFIFMFNIKQRTVPDMAEQWDTAGPSAARPQ